MKKLPLFYLALAAAACLLILLALAAALKSVPILGQALTVAVIFFEIFIPIEIIKYFKLAHRDFNIYVHNLESLFDLILPPFKAHAQIDVRNIKKELKSFCFTSLVVLAPYVAGYWLFFKWRALEFSQDLTFSFNLPPNLFFEIIMQLLIVAVPEELFFRGFLQSAFLRHGLGLTGSIVLVNFIFALSHLANFLSPVRLLTFFPGLIFSFLVYKNKSLLSAILFHATCNILGQILYLSVFLNP